MQKRKLLEIDLRLFDGAAGAAAGGDAGGGTAQATEGLPKAGTRSGSGSSRRSRSGEYDNVVFGKQDVATSDADAGIDPAAGGTGEGSTSGVSTTSNTLEERRKAFDAMIEGEYKDVFNEKFQKTFNRRFAQTKGMEESLAAQKPILDMLMQRYKIGDGDMAKLQTAIEQDSAYWEDAAEEAGLTVEQYKTMQKLERENAELQQYRQRQLGEQQAQQKMNEWYAQADGLKEIYPDFDLQTECGNRDFIGLLKSGLSVQQAYELIHMEEIKAAAARSAAQAAGTQIVAKIKSKAARPSENGTSSQSAVIVKNDVHSLSRADRAEAIRRAQRGEKISF